MQEQTNCLAVIMQKDDDEPRRFVLCRIQIFVRRKLQVHSGSIYLASDFGDDFAVPRPLQNSSTVTRSLYVQFQQ